MPAGGDTASVFADGRGRVTPSVNSVGSYAVTQGTLLVANSSDTFGPANFAGTPAAVTVTVTASQSKVYGTADPVFAYTYSALAAGDTAWVCVCERVRVARGGCRVVSDEVTQRLLILDLY